MKFRSIESNLDQVPWYFCFHCFGSEINQIIEFQYKKTNVVLPTATLQS